MGYSPNLADGTVSIVNLTSHTVTGIISGFRYPWNVNVSPDGSTLFVDDVPLTDPLADRIDVVDLCSHQIVERIPTHGMAFSSISLDGSQLYTADITGGAVQVVDTSTGSLTATFPTLPVPIATASGDDRTLWIATMPDFLYSIDMRTGKVVGSPILTGIAPAQIAVSPDGSTLAVADLGGDIELIDTQTHRVTSTIRLPSLSYPAFGAFTPDGSELWMGYYSGQVAVIDMHTDAVVKVGQTGGFAVGIAFTRDGKEAYVSTTPAGSVIPDVGAVYAVPALLDIWRPGGVIRVFDTSTFFPVATIDVGNVPMAMTIASGPFN